MIEIIEQNSSVTWFNSPVTDYCKLYKSFNIPKKTYIFSSQHHFEDIILNEKIINNLKNNNAYIIFLEDVEYSTWSSISYKFTTLSKIIPKQNICILTANLMFDDIKQCPYKTFYHCNYFNYSKTQYLKKQNYLKLNKYNKHFNYLAKRYSYDRHYFYFLLEKFKLTEKGNISYNLTDNILNDDSDLKFLSFIKKHLNQKDFNTFLEFKDTSLSLDNSIIELRQEQDNDPSFIKFLSPSDALLDVIIESNTDSGILFLSEKISKTILCKKPFLLLGNPNSLKALKHFGFMTFDKIFDESYDSIHNKLFRFNTVFKQLKSFCDTDIETAQKLINDVQDVLDYNYNHFLNSFDCTFNIKSNVESYFWGVFKGEK